MDTIKILKSILAGNSTSRQRTEQARQPRQQPSSGRAPRRTPRQTPNDVGGMLEDMLGVGREKGRASTPRHAEPQRQPEPRRDTSPPIFETRRRPRRQEPEVDKATTLIRAMCNASKVDGDIDREEQDAIIGRLGDVTQDEIDFVRRELKSPLDIDAFCDSVPDELAQQAYAFSVMAIKIDTISEAAYLGRLGATLELDTDLCNDIHEQVGAPCIYA